MSSLEHSCKHRTLDFHGVAPQEFLGMRPQPDVVCERPFVPQFEIALPREFDRRPTHSSSELFRFLTMKLELRIRIIVFRVPVQIKQCCITLTGQRCEAECMLNQLSRIQIHKSRRTLLELSHDDDASFNTGGPRSSAVTWNELGTMRL